MWIEKEDRDRKIYEWAEEEGIQKPGIDRFVFYRNSVRDEYSVQLNGSLAATTFNDLKGEVNSNHFRSLKTIIYTEQMPKTLIIRLSIIQKECGLGELTAVIEAVSHLLNKCQVPAASFLLEDCLHISTILGVKKASESIDQESVTQATSSTNAATVKVNFFQTSSSRVPEAFKKIEIPDDEETENQKDDVKDMFKRLMIFSFQKKEFDGIDQISTHTSDTCRTTRAHYRARDFRITDIENVCRTTITMPDSKVDYIECRTTPDTDSGVYEIGIYYGTVNWSIGFHSDEEAKNFLTLLYTDERILAAQRKIDNDRFFANKIGKIAKKYEKNIIHFHRNVDLVLDFLVESNYCQQEVIDQQKEQLRGLGHGTHLGFKL